MKEGMEKGGRHERVVVPEGERLAELHQSYEAMLATFSGKAPKDAEGNSIDEPSPREKKTHMITQAYQDILRRLHSDPEVTLSDIQKAVLQLKLARHFQNNNTIDISTLYDALKESPKFLNETKGSLHRLFEIHEAKTLQKIAEIRKKRAEMTGNEEFNPFEWIYQTQDGKYALARLLNMPHLEEESSFMNHCVGTSDSYVNKMKRGEVEIFSVRTVPQLDARTGTLTPEKPVLTIEYNVKTGVIEQVRTVGDAFLQPTDSYYEHVLEILKALKASELDTGGLRTIRSIEKSEIEHFPNPKSGYLLTDRGEISWEEFDPRSSFIVLKANIETSVTASKDIFAKMLFVFQGIDVRPDEIARTVDEMHKNTRAYVGDLYPGFFSQLPDTVEHIFTSLDHKEVLNQTIEIGGKSERELGELLEHNGHQIYPYIESMMRHDDFGRSLREEDLTRSDWKKWKLKSSEEIKLVNLCVEDLGFPNGATTSQIYARAQELGLEFCPPEVGPQLRLQYVNQPVGECVHVGMKRITDSGGDSYFFGVERNEAGSWLSNRIVGLSSGWHAKDRFVFRLSRPDPLLEEEGIDGSGGISSGNGGIEGSEGNGGEVVMP